MPIIFPTPVARPAIAVIATLLTAVVPAASLAESTTRAWLSEMELGNADMRQKSFGSARKHFLQALSLTHAEVLDDPKAATTLRYLGDTEQSAGNLKAAQNYFKQEAELLARISPVFPDIVYDEFQQGRICLKATRYEEALQHFQKAWDIRKQNVAVHSPRTNGLLVHLAMAKALNNRLPEARKSLSLLGSTSRFDKHFFGYDLFEGRGDVRQSRLTLPESAKPELKANAMWLELLLAEKSVSWWRENAGKNPARYAQALDDLGSSLADAGRAAEAAAARQKAIGILTKVKPSDEVINGLIGVLKQCPVDAEYVGRAYEHAWRAATALEDKDQRQRASWIALKGLAMYYHAQSQWQKAIDTRARAMQLARQAETPEADGATLEMLEQQIYAQTVLGQQAESRKSAQAHGKMVGKLIPASQRPIYNSNFNLTIAGAYSAIGDFVKAEEFARKAQRYYSQVAPADYNFGRDFEISWWLLKALLHNGKLKDARVQAEHCLSLQSQVPASVVRDHGPILAKLIPALDRSGNKDYPSLEKMADEVLACCAQKNTTGASAALGRLEKLLACQDDRRVFVSVLQARLAALARQNPGVKGLADSLTNELRRPGY